MTDARRGSLAGGALVAAVAGVVTGLTRWAGPSIYCGDGWFHVRYATILRHEGISRTFPWWQESFLRDRFTDFNLLYHLLLIPFTLGNELTGARVASVVIAAAAMGAFWWALREFRVPHPELWAIALLALSPDFAYRLTYTRPLVLGFVLLFLGTAAVLRGRPLAAFVLTFLYAHTHCSFHLLPCVALLHDAQRAAPPGTRGLERFRTSIGALGGAAAGSLLTPYFPNNLSFWWTANLGVLKTSWEAGDLLRVGTEMLPVRSDEMLAAHLGVFLLFGLALVGLTRLAVASDEARTLLVAAFGFLGLTFLSQRFAELWAPFTVLLAAVVARDLRPMPSSRILRLSAAGLCLIALASGLMRTLEENQAAAAGEDPPLWRPAARWMKANVPAGETIFHLGWDEFPQLFFEDTTHRYLIGQDATFFWATDPVRCRLWADLARGRAGDAWGPVRRTFGCRFAFVPRRYVSFLRLARRDPRFVEAWSDASAFVFRVDDDGGTIGGWVPHGFQPDPARTLFDLPQDGEPGGEPGAAGSPVVGTGFVDIGSVSRVPEGVRDACAVVTTTIDGRGGGPAKLGLTTDDEVKLYVGGELVYARSPYRSPAVSLDELFRGPARRGAEVEVPVRLAAGPNAVAVKDCRVGDDFGFVLRAR